MSEGMSRAEMLKTLSEMQAYHGNSRFGMALSMAIAALESQVANCETCKFKDLSWDEEPCDGCCENHNGYSALSAEPCSDAISRQAAENLFRNARAKLDASKYKTMAEFNLRDSMLLNAEQMIHLLPSVHAEPRTGQSKSIPSGLKLKIEREADYQNERVNADIARGMYLALEIIDKWEADHA